MYKVLIVDDEEPARETFNYLINWDKTMFRIAGFAKNGAEALAQYSKLKPDLIVTDIQMPVMDGLEFIRRVRLEDKEQKFVILSCHENFKYAKEAIQLGVSDYLLKDLLTPQDLYSLLEKVRSEIEAQNQLKINDSINKLYNSDSSYREEYKNIVLKNIVFDNLTEDVIASHCDKFHLNFSARYKVLMCIMIDDYIKFMEKNDRTEEKRKKHDILNLIKVTLDEFYGGECFYDEKGNYVAVAGIGETASELYIISNCHSIANKLHTNISRTFNITVTIGISSSFSSLRGIRTKYDEATELVKYRVFLGKGKTILYNVQFVKAAGKSLNSGKIDSTLKDIRACLGKGEVQNAKKLVMEIYKGDINGFAQYNYLKYLNTQMLGIVMEFCGKNNISYKSIFGHDYLPIEMIDEFETVQEMSDWFMGIMERLVDICASGNTPIYSKHVKDSIRYINEKYCSKLSLSQVSEELGVNKAYLCRIFKQETGENLTDYLNAVRIEAAKELMASTNCRIYEIAEKVGFSSMQHFNNSFKKITGQNPMKFRNRMDVE